MYVQVMSMNECGNYLKILKLHIKAIVPFYPLQLKHIIR